MSEYCLVHHGIKGQKWGVRRFRNEDGSLTPAGMRRYRISSKYERKGGSYTKKGIEKYKHNVDELEKTKQKYEAGDVNKDALKTARYRVRKSKRDLRDDYLADQGKEMYRQGKRITSNGIIGSAVSEGAALAGSVYVYNYLSSRMSRQKAMTVAGLIAGSATAINLGTNAVMSYRNRRLRAFYGH